MVDVEGASYRKIIGPARFLHNDTYLLCDTALWNVETKIIEAWGNVSILQEETVLTSDKLTYLIDDDLAQFRGSLVQLEDKDHNTLRTRYLDYNTKDSLAIFQKGGAMRDKDGQIIESENGTYDSKAKLFTFTDKVNMFTDSVFVKTNSLKYESEKNLATFGSGTNAWQKDNMLSSDSGWYNREKEIFFFNNNVHVMSDSQEGWCDSLYFYRNTSDVEMLGNAQVTDTTRNVFALAGRIQYLDSLSKVTLTREPAVITETEDQQGVKDTVYLGADRLVYYTLQIWQVDSMAVVNAQKRLEVLEQDPVSSFRKKAAQEAAKAAEEAAKNDPNYLGKTKAKNNANQKLSPDSRLTQDPKAPAKAQDDAKGTGDALVKNSDKKADADTAEVSDTTKLSDALMLSDSTAVADSLGTVADSIAVLPPKDTTKISFLEALKNVRVFRKDMQVVCDSLVYSDLDSLARLFLEPVIWQEETRQYSSDSLFVAVTQGGIEKASLMGNAFIAIQEDSLHYDQIKSTEMMAYFDDKGGLRRFDALGGASALFYLEENDALATVNKADSKMLSATFKDGELQRVYYFENAKNDGYPVVQLSKEDMYLKGFKWQNQRRPANRNAVTPLSLRPSQRLKYAARPRAKFTQTDRYFPGYMGDIYRQIQVRDSLRLIRQQEAELAKLKEKESAAEGGVKEGDKLIELKDSLLKTDLPLDSLITVVDTSAIVDSLAVADSLVVGKVDVADSVAVVPAVEQKSQKQIKQEAKEAAKKARKEAQEARWAEQEKQYEAKQKAKEEKALAKAREKKRKALEAMAKQADRDAAVFEKYKKKYEAQRDRQNARKAQKNQKQSQRLDGSQGALELPMVKSPEKLPKKSLNSRLNEGDMVADQIIKGL